MWYNKSGDNMSRTYKDMPKTRKKRWRIIKNSMYKKIMNCYSEDIVGRRKDRRINRTLRARLKRMSKNFMV